MLAAHPLEAWHLRTPPVSPSPAGAVHFTFTGTVGQTYQVQATADWASWTTVTTVTCTVSPMSVTLPDQNGLSRFYRIMQPGK